MKPFVHLHLHTEFSLLDGAARIKKVVKLCKEYNMPAVAITDHGNMYGTLALWDACQGTGVKPIFGTEFYVADDLNIKTGKQKLSHLIILAKDQTGYQNLCMLNTIAFRDGFYYKPRIDYPTLEKYHEGLICLSACLAGDIPKLIVADQLDKAEELVLWFKRVFGDDFYLELQYNGIAEQEIVNAKLREYSKKFGIKTVATNDVHYLYREDAEMQDVLMCVAMQKFVDDPDRLKFPTDELYFKTYDQMLSGLPNDEDALATTLEIADKCNVTFEYGHYLYPRYTPDGGYNDKVGATPKEYMQRLVDEGVQRKYGGYNDTIRKRVDMEMGIIEKTGYIEYFLIVWDYINAARKMDISVGPGRGSGAGSIVAYTMGITDVDPLRFELFFERFLNLDRVSAPDFDVDFEDTRRDDIIEYVRKKYGADSVARIITFGTMKAKNAIKDVGRVLRVPYSVCDRITKNIPMYKSPILPKAFGFHVPKEGDKDFGTVYAVPELVEMYNNDPQVKKVVDIAMKVEDFPRQTSIHACGVIIGKDRLDKFVPLSRNGDIITTQFQAAEMEHLGHLKMDFLALRNLTEIKDTIKYVKENHGVEINFEHSNYDDPNVFKYLSTGKTDGIFQIESGGFQRFFRELQPSNIEDIVAAIALYRPGPMQYIPKYTHNKHHPEDTTYDHPLLEPILNVTYGCIVYQEQVMRVFQDLAGFSLGQADEIRRAMGKKKIDQLMKWKESFLNGRAGGVDEHGKEIRPIKGCIANGVSEQVANKIWNDMEAFASYAFNKSHAAAYAVIVYQTAYLKYYYLPEFITSILNHRMNSIDKVKQIIAYAKEDGIEILPPDINESGPYFKTDGKKIRFGLAALKNVGVGVMEDLIREREANGKFTSFEDYINRVDAQALNKRCVESLIKTGAFDCFGYTRSQLMSIYSIMIDRAQERKRKIGSDQVTLFGELIDDTPLIEPNEIPKLNEYVDTVKLQYEKEMAGTYLSGHPLDSFMDMLRGCNFNSSLLPDESLDDEMESDEDNLTVDSYQAALENQEQEEELYGGLQNGDHVTCGGVIANIKTIQTKNGSRMALLTVEDLTGSFDVWLFPKVYERLRDSVKNDAIVYIKGKFSLRDGHRPSISADDLEIMQKQTSSESEQTSLPDEVEFEKPKKLWLKYNIADGVLQDAVNKILSSYNGISEVYVKDTGTNKAYKSNLMVNIKESLIYELETILEPSCIFIQ